MGSYYEINVSLRGHHYFATAERSIRYKETAQQMTEEFRKRFPESEGFSVTCTHQESIGHRTDF